MRYFIMVACLLPFFAVNVRAQRMASTYANLQAFLDSCPQNDPYLPIIQRDFQITRDQVPVGAIACTEPYTQMPASEITDELSVLQTLRFMYYMDMGQSGYLPWTPLRLYDWVKSRVGGVNIGSTVAGGDCCTIINNVDYITVGSLAAVAAADGTTVAFQAQYRQTAVGQAVNVGLFAHETRHTEGNGYPHVTGCPQFPTGGAYGCDETYDLTNLSPYAIQYYLANQMLTGGINLGYSCDPTTQTDLGTEFQGLVDVFVGRFVTNNPPQVSLPADAGGACIPASTFTLNTIPSQFNSGASLSLGITASNPLSGWTADSTVSWITPTTGMNSIGSGQAVFAVNPTASSPAQTGSVVAAGVIVPVTCESGICTFSATTTISFGALSDVTVAAPPFIVSATASSGLPVSFTSTTPSVCTVSGSTVTIAGTGMCSITATQAGNASYSAATPVTQSFNVTGQTPQTITFDPVSNVSIGVTPFALSATASSGLPVTFVATIPSVCTVSGSTVTIIAEGTCSITASQTGDSTYAAAPSVTQSFPVLGASQTMWRLSATFADGGTAVGYFIFDASANTFPNWDVSTAGGNTTVFFPFDFNLENSVMEFDSNDPSGLTVYFASAALFPDAFGLPENLYLVPALASSIADSPGPINILPGAVNGSGKECFDCDPSRLIISGVVTSTGPLPPAVTVTPSSLSIGSAQPLTVTVAVNGGSSYPTPLGTVTLTSGSYSSGLTTLSGGIAMISIPAGSLSAGTDTLAVTYMPALSIASTYNSASGSIAVTVSQATPVITWATPASITYGTTLSSTQLDATASVPGTFVYSPAVGNTPAAGTDTLSVTFTPTDTTDYTTATQTVSLTVNKATPTIIWATPASVTAGTTLSSTQLNATASVPGTFAYSPAVGTTPAAGSDTLSVTFTPTDTADYNTATATVTLEVENFTFAASSGSSTTVSVTPGQTATYTLGVGGEGGLSGTIGFSITGAPSEATCAVSPNPAALGTNVTVTCSTTAPSAASPRSTPPPPTPPLSPGVKGLLALALFLAAWAWSIMRRRRTGDSRWRSVMIPLASGILLTMALAGCGGGGGGGGGGGTTSNPGTPAGTYTLTVTGTTGSGSSALSHSVTLTLTVS